MKKMFSLALALIMALALCVPTMAAGNDLDGIGAADDATGSITIGNPTQTPVEDQEGNVTNVDSTYKAYKIFDVTYTGVTATTGNYAYTIESDSPWYDTVAAYASEAENADGLTLVPSVDATDKTVVVEYDLAKFSAAKFAAHLKSNIPDKAVAEDFTNNVAAGLELGYWFVTSSLGSLCNLTTTDNTVTIYDKNEVVFEKTDTAADVEVGDTVNYTITGKVPDTTGYTEYVYTISDTMSTGLTFKKDVVVKVDGAVLETEHYTLTNNTNGFTLTIDVMEIQDQVTKAIEVTYTALVNDNAVAVVSKNAATLTYTNDPATGSTKTTLPDEETVWSSEILIDKYDGTEIPTAAELIAKAKEEGKTTTSAKEINDQINAAIEKAPRLSGAKFVLKNESGAFYKYTAAIAGSPAVEDDPATEGVDESTPAVEASPATVTWYTLAQGETIAAAVEAGKITEVETVAGAAEFNGLKDGKYYLVETVAPTGYNLMADEYPVVVAGGDAEAQLSYTAEVANLTGTELPSTGGMGTTIFYTVGGVMMAAAVVLFVTKKKLAVQE